MDRRIWYLATAETITWAGTVYLFPALLLHWERDLAWSKAELAPVMTLALLVSAGMAPLMGRLIDRDLGRVVLTGSAGLAAILLAALALAEQRWQFVGLWLLLGVAMAGGLYEPCFAFVTRTRGADARKAITRITLVAGFAGTVSFPIANLVAEAAHWRASVLVFAALVAGVAVPLYWLGTAAPERPPPPEAAPSTVDAKTAPGVGILRRPTYWLLATAFSSIALTHGMVLAHLLPILDERGIGTALAVTVASLIGPMQVAGRLAMVAVERWMSVVAICGVTYLFMMGAAASLLVAGAVPALLWLWVLLYGSGYGVTSITRPVVTATFLGREGFGAISGAIALPYLLSFAVGPSLAAALWAYGGYDMVLVAVLILLVAGALCFLAAARLRSSPP